MRVMLAILGAASLLAACEGKGGRAPAAGGAAAGSPDALLNPEAAEVQKKAPDTYRIRFDTSVGRVVEGMDVVDRIYAGYGERPDQQLIEMQGNAYLAKQFPRLDSIAKAQIVR